MGDDRALHPCEELRASDSRRDILWVSDVTESSWSGLWAWKWVGALQDSEGWSRQEGQAWLARHLYPNTHVPAERVCTHMQSAHTQMHARAARLAL